MTDAFGTSDTPVHVIDCVCMSQRLVTRSAFSAELLGARDATDQGILISHMLAELELGAMTVHAARDRRMSGGYLPTALHVDAKSVFVAATTTFIKQPAEQSLRCHVQYLRELPDEGIVQETVWLDTRDMGADLGLLKVLFPGRSPMGPCQET